MADKFLTLTFKNTFDPDLSIGYGTGFGIIDTSGFDGSDYVIETEDYAYDGGYLKKQRMGVRSIGIHFAYRNDSARAKERVLSFFTPYKPGRLTVNAEGTVRAIDYYVKKLENKRDNMFDDVEFELQLTCPSGYFEDVDYNLVDLASWEGGFSLHDETQNDYSPTSITPADATQNGSPFYLRHRTNGIKSIFNRGHASAPMWITFRGPAKYPKIKNLHNGKEIQIATELGTNDTLEIKTFINNPEIYIQADDGTKKNAYPYLTTNSSLEFYLDLGENNFQYTSANPDQINDVVIQYKQLYVGV
ncbi:MAG: phage distal tail protein [Pseudoramibacter sp.]